MDKVLLIGLLVFSMFIHAEVVEDFTSECNKGDPTSCFELGVIYFEGLEIEEDYFKSMQYYSTACNAGKEIACHNLGYMYVKGYDILDKASSEYIDRYVQANELYNDLYASESDTASEKFG